MELITNETITAFEAELRRGEKAEATVEKYIHAICRLMLFLNGAEVTKEALLSFRDEIRKLLRDQTVNGYISAVNAYLAFAGLEHLKLKLLRTQRQPFRESERELTEPEYERLVAAAKKQQNDRLYHILITLAGTGIRISELAYITVDAVQCGRAVIRMKGKARVILIPDALKKKLTRYIQKKGLPLRPGVSDAQRKTPGSLQYRPHDEKPVPGGEGVAPEGVPAQPAAFVRAAFLRRGEKPRPSCGCARPQPTGDDAALCHVH